MSQTRTIHFHVGAHKTATTYVQSRLRSNKQHLRSQGISFVDLWAKGAEEASYRSTLKKAIEGDRVDEQRTAQAAVQLRGLVDRATAAGPAFVVMSYENVLGDYDMTKSGAPYPHAEHAVGQILQAFPTYHLKIFFAFRALDRFLESGYVQRVCTRLETRKFKDYIDLIDTVNFSWMPAVRAMASVVGRENLVAWAYDDFIVDETPVWNALLSRPDANTLLISPARKTNSSLSRKGLKYMRGINRLATSQDAKKFRPFVRSNFASKAGDKPLKLLDDARREVLVANYERSRDEIGSCCQLLIESTVDPQHNEPDREHQRLL